MSDVRLYPMIGKTAKVSLWATILMPGGRLGCALASAAFTRSSVWNMSTVQLKYRSISAEPRLVIDFTSSIPCTPFTASSRGRVTVTSI